jgi:uncharacterized protein YndB with AHSA1/START domain
MTQVEKAPIIVVETVIRGTMERVFRALTSAEELAQWWDGDERYPNLSWAVDDRAGGEWLSRWRNLEGREVNLGGRILEFEPPRRMVWSWFFDEFPDAGESRVEYLLEEAGEGVRLQVTHTGFRSTREAAYEDYSKGWYDVLGRIQRHVEA